MYGLRILCFALHDTSVVVQDPIDLSTGRRGIQERLRNNDLYGCLSIV